jgi:hypothetical protein
MDTLYSLDYCIAGLRDLAIKIGGLCDFPPGLSPGVSPLLRTSYSDPFQTNDNTTNPSEQSTNADIGQVKSSKQVANSCNSDYDPIRKALSVKKFPSSWIYPTMRMCQVSVSTDRVSRMGMVPYVYDAKIKDYWLGIAVGRAWGNLTTIGGVYEPDQDHNLLSTLYREVREETGDYFKVPSPDFIGHCPVIYHKNTYTVLVEYPAEVMDHSMKPTEELNTVVWFTRKQLHVIYAMSRRVANLRLSFSSYLEPIILPLTCGVDLSCQPGPYPPPHDYREQRPVDEIDTIGSYEDVIFDADKYRWYHIDVVLAGEFAWLANGAVRKYKIQTDQLSAAVDSIKRANNRSIKVYSESGLPGHQSLELEIRRWRKKDSLADNYRIEYSSSPDDSKIDVIVKYEQLAYNLSKRSHPSDMSRINGIKFIDSVNRLIRGGICQLPKLVNQFLGSPWIECLTSKIYTISNEVVNLPS